MTSTFRRWVSVEISYSASNCCVCIHLFKRSPKAIFVSAHGELGGIDLGLAAGQQIGEHAP